VTPTLQQEELPASHFTYSTRNGEIWRIDTEGHRVQLLAADSIQKVRLKWSDDHQWLHYVAYQYPDGVRWQTLFVINQEGTIIKQLIGPYRELTSEWQDNNHILAGVTDAPRTMPPWGRTWFRINVQTGISVSLGLDAYPRATFTPFAEPRLVEAPNGTKGSTMSVEQARLAESRLVEAPNGQWAVLSQPEGDTRVFYLLDAEGNTVAPIYQQPADIFTKYTKWSPDGRWFIFAPLENKDDYDGDLYLYNPRDLSTRRLTTYEERDEAFSMMGFSWSPNGEWLRFEISDAEGIKICIMHFGDTPDLRCFLVGSTAQHTWSSDSRFIAFLNWAASDIYLLEMSSGEIRNLTNDGKSRLELKITVD
jgi:Tol biopolymer transport system component